MVGARRWLILAAVALGIFMVMVDVTIVNVALPLIREDFGFLEVSTSELQWVVNAYTLALAVLLLTAGRVTDLIGGRVMFIVGVVLFCGASVVCGLAGDVNTMIAGRVIQGVGAAIITPTTLALIANTFAPKERGIAIGIWSAMVGLGAAIGPLVGGTLAEQLDWSWIFFVNVPIGVVTVIIAVIWVREVGQPTEDKSLDFLGLLTSGVGLFALVYALLQGNETGWGDPVIVGLLILAPAAFVAFVLIERRQRLPMIDLSLFRSRTFTAANVLSAFVGFCLLGLIFYSSLFIQGVMGYSATETGAALLPMTGLIMIFSGVSAKLVEKIGPRPVLTIGMLLLTVSLLLFSRLDFESDFWDLLPADILGGIGFAFSLPPLTVAALAGVPVQQAGVGAAVLNAMRQAGGALGLGILGAISAEELSASLLEGETRPDGFVDGYETLMVTAAGVALIGAVVAWLLVTKRAPSVAPVPGLSGLLQQPSGLMSIPVPDAAKPSALPAQPQLAHRVIQPGAARPGVAQPQPATPAAPAAAPAPPAIASLEVIEGPAAGAKISMEDGSFTIGRSETGEGKLGDDGELSRRHARIVRSDGGLQIEDLGSTNGTFVNGQRISAPTGLRPGDLIGVGTTKIRVPEPPPRPAAPVPKPAAAPISAGAPGEAQELIAIQPTRTNLRIQPNRARIPQQAPILEVVSGPRAGARIALGYEPFVIGRAEPGDGSLGQDIDLSRRHASVALLDATRVVVEDLGSTNGTWVNQHRIASPTVIRAGDSVRVGNSELTVSPA